jgi:hypothetical protein
MTAKKISDLTVADVIDGTELAYIVQGGQDRQASIGALIAPAVSPSELATAVSAAATQAVGGVLAGNMPNPAFAPGSVTAVFDANHVTGTVTNTTTETSLGHVTVPAGSVNALTKILVSVIGHLFNNTATTTHTYRLKINGTTVWTYARSQTASGNNVAWCLDFLITCPDDQTQYIRCLGGFAGGGGVGDATNGVAFAGTGPIGYSNQLIDMSGASTIDLTVQMSTASTSTTNDRYAITGEMVTPLS